MKDKTLHALTLATKILSIITGLSSYSGIIPSKWQVVSMLVFGAASIAKDAVIQFSDLLDDGKVNGSIK